MNIISKIYSMFTGDKALVKELVNGAECDMGWVTMLMKEALQLMHLGCCSFSHFTGEERGSRRIRS